MQFDVSSFMRNISPLHLEGGWAGRGAINQTERRRWNYQSLLSIPSFEWVKRRLFSFFFFFLQDAAVCSTASQQGQPADNQILKQAATNLRASNRWMEIQYSGVRLTRQFLRVVCKSAKCFIFPLREKWFSEVILDVYSIFFPTKEPASVELMDGDKLVSVLP